MMTALGTTAGGSGQRACWWSQWLQHWEAWAWVTELLMVLESVVMVWVVVLGPGGHPSCLYPSPNPV